MGLTTLAWYALPDLVRSRGARTVLKLGLVGAGGAAWVLARPEKPLPTGAQGPDTFDVLFEAIRTEPATTLGLGAAIVGITAALTVAGEKAVFRFGERRRARGARGAHTVPALVLGVLGAASAAVPLP
ncbi:MAG TPA: peptidase S9 [Propionibacterium sp.]|nr:peptidase S9 [Propionibacterium sp.]